jgi:primosomal protein N' (replication factor Y)
VEVVDLRQELRVGNRSMFSRALQEALARTLQARQQAILFLNRRGAATFVMCRDCGHVLRCRRCEVPLTYHMEDSPDETPSLQPSLVCHHCNRREPLPQRCPICDSRRIRHFGAGTQRVEAEVKRLFPRARTLRWDWDATRSKGAHEVILAQFSTHQADVLVGTQMIAKGLDLPLVTLVGVVSADTALHLPDFRSNERTFQLLTQVAGRAGRGILGGRVIVQTYTPEHYAVRAAAKHDYAAFYEREMAYRRQMDYPPLSRLAKVVAVDESPRDCREASEAVADMLDERIAARGASVSLIGPVPCFFARHRGRSRWQVVVRASDPVPLLRGLSLPPNCWVDVDPVSLL